MRVVVVAVAAVAGEVTITIIIGVEETAPTIAAGSCEIEAIARVKVRPRFLRLYFFNTHSSFKHPYGTTDVAYLPRLQ